MNEKQAKSQSKSKKKRKIFIGGLDKKVNEYQLKEYFSKYGEVERATINREHYTDKSRGSGFILFSDSDSAKRALNDPSPHILNNKLFDCQPCLLRNEIKEKKKSFGSFGKFGYSTDNSKKSSINDFRMAEGENPPSFGSFNNFDRRASSSSGGNLSPSIGESSSNEYEESMFIEERRFEIVENERRKYSKYQWERVEEFNDRSNYFRNLSKDKLCYYPPTYHPRKDDFVNKNEILDVIIKNTEGRIKGITNDNNEPEVTFELPKRCDTPCNFQVELPEEKNEHLMLYKPEPVQLPKQRMRLIGFPVDNYVLNMGNYAHVYRSFRSSGSFL